MNDDRLPSTGCV